MPSTSHCCCDCPTKEQAGLPDYIEGTFTATPDGSPTLPSDIEADSCTGGSWYNRFANSSALIDLLGTLTFDYVESVASSTCASCCFRYVGRGTYTPDCPENAASDFILFGASPFDSKACGAAVNYHHWTGSDTPAVGVGGDTCCPDTEAFDCNEFCGYWYETYNGDTYSPQPIYGAADLIICVNDQVVTICIPITFVIPCKVYSSSGSCVFVSDYEGGVYPNCHVEESNNCDDTVTQTCATVEVDLLLTATADLSGVSGADIWEKIKNAPAGTWVSEYEYAACSCAGGCCSDSYIEVVCACDILADCNCTANDATSELPECADGVDYGAGPVDRECLYSTGTIEVVFDDGVAP